MLINEGKELTAPAIGRLRTVIIGGGTVGLYAAHELVKRGQEVVVVESGGLALDNFPPDSYASVGKPHEGIRLGRARNLGGTSNLWGGQLVEFQPADFEGRDWIPDSKWPVTYSEISAYHQRTYENLGISREFLDDRQVFNHAGGAMSDFSGGLELFFTRWLKIPSFSVAYAQEIRSNEKLKVLLNHTVIGFAGSMGGITAIRTIDLAGKKQLIEGDCFILAAGTIEISRLLLHAAATPGWDCPWRHNKNVGAFFQDHVVGRVASLEVLDRRRFFKTFSTIVWSGHKFQPKLRLKDETLQRSRIMNIQGMMSFESSISENLVYLKQFLKAALYSRKLSGIGDLGRNLRACGKHLIPLMWKYVVDNRVLVPSTSKISLNIQSEQTPLRESRISIDPAVTDAAGLPKVILDWKVGSEELTSIGEFTILCDRALRASGLASLRITGDLTKLEPQFLTTLRDNYHHAGGSRMGETEKDGVVDRNLRVFGTTNLYVAGAASFRTTSNANTTFTALAFVTRLVDHLTSSIKD
jgi:choline dehydrogenase-like flavoprotein